MVSLFQKAIEHSQLGRIARRSPVCVIPFSILLKLSVIFLVVRGQEGFDPLKLSTHKWLYEVKPITVGNFKPTDFDP